MKTSFTARLLITALSVAALSSAARADDLNIKTMIPAPRRLTPNHGSLSITTLARYWLKTMPTPPRPGQSDQNDDQLCYRSGDEAGKFKESDLVTVGNDAGPPATRFSKALLMFLKPGMQVPVSQLIRGINLQSGNDACVAMADYVAGSRRLRQPDEQLRQRSGPENTHFQTVHGLDADGQYSSARDMALIGRR